MTRRQETADFDPEEASRGTSHPGGDLPIGAPVRVGRLQSLVSLRAELSRLYRESRRRVGRYPTPLEAQRLATVLGSVRVLVELEAYEARLTALEKRLAP